MFERFNAIFVFFWETLRIRMLKTFKRAPIYSPIVFYEEINAILYQKIDPKNDKNLKIFWFLTILSNFCQIFDILR